MLKRVIHFPLLSLVCLSFLPMYGCSNGGDDGSTSFGSFGTTQTTVSTTMTTMEEEESGDGDPGDGDPGDGDPGDGDPGDGDPGDGDPGDGDPGDGDGDSGCPPEDYGQYGCPCDNGACAAGLACVNGECELGGGDGDGDGDPTGDGDGDPWDPSTCVMPSIIAGVADIMGEFCSAPCVADLDCPPGPVGTDAACLLLLDPMDVDPSGCVLICDPVSDACPAGSSCKDVPDQPGIGVCTYP
jgi:hypothetical protein